MIWLHCFQSDNYSRRNPVLQEPALHCLQHKLRSKLSTINSFVEILKKYSFCVSFYCVILKLKCFPKKTITYEIYLADKIAVFSNFIENIECLVISFRLCNVLNVSSQQVLILQMNYFSTKKWFLTFLPFCWTGLKFCRLFESVSSVWRLGSLEDEMFSLESN